MLSSSLRKEIGGSGSLTCLLGYGCEVSAWNERIREMFSVGRIYETGLSVGWRLTRLLVLTNRGPLDLLGLTAALSYSE